MDGLLTFFDQYEWVAEVEVPACEAKVSYDRAMFLTRNALNIIKLMLGRQHTYRLRTAEDPGHALKSAKLHRDQNGTLRISVTNTSNDNVLDDDWVEALIGENKFYFQHAGRALHLSAGFAEAPPLCVRFINALYWYGDSIAEKSAAARIVKFVSAVEGMTGTGPERDAAGKKVRGVTEIVTTRATIFHQFNSGKTLAESQKLVSRVYDWRSNILVHGSVSPFDDEIVGIAREAEEVAREVLLTGLDYFVSIGLDDPKMTPKELCKRFVELEQKGGTPPGKQ